MTTDNTALPPAYPGENYTPNTQSEKTWRHGLCNCLDDPKFCFIGCFVPGSLLFGIADRTKNMVRGTKVLLALSAFLVMFGLVEMVNMGGSSVDNSVVKSMALFLEVSCVVLLLVAFAVFIYHTAKLRGEVRAKYRIQGSEMGDLCTVLFCELWCFGLHNCQMFQEVQDQEGVQEIVIQSV